MSWERILRNVKQTVSSESATHALHVSAAFSDLLHKKETRTLVGVTVHAQYYGPRLEDAKANTIRDALADHLGRFNVLPDMKHPLQTERGIKPEQLESRKLVFRFNLPPEEIANLEAAFLKIHPNARKTGGENTPHFQWVS